MAYTMLDALNQNNDSWMIRVRVCRMWESANPNTGEQYSLDMILIDEKENLIHATIQKHLVSRYTHLLNEGCLYSIKNLRVVASTGRYRPLSYEFKLLFLRITTIKKLEEGIINIPLHGFQFISPDMIDARVNDTNILSDLVGCLTYVGGIDVVTGGWKKRDLKIVTNYSITSTVTLWEKMAEEFDPNLCKEDDGPYILIVTSTQVKKFKKQVGFSTTRNSKIYINLDTPYVASLRERIAQLSAKLEISGDSLPRMLPEEKMFINRMNIEDLLGADWSEDLKEQIVTVRAEIFGIDNSRGWYYLGCKVCSTKGMLNDGVYTCKSCNEIIDYPLMMFRIEIKVKDKTGDTTFVLFNNVAEPLLDTSVNKIVNKLSSDNKDVPKEFEGLLGKDIVFKLRLNAFNLKDGLHNFTVGEIFEPQEILEQEYELKKSVKDSKYLLIDEPAPVHDEKRRKISMADDDKEDNGARDGGN